MNTSSSSHQNNSFANLIHKTLRLSIPLISAFFLLFAFLWLLGARPTVIAAGPRYVATTGSDAGNNDCLNQSAPCATVQQAVDKAAAGDEIRVAAGTYSGVNTTGGYTQTVYLDKSVILRGGYTTTNWVESDPTANPTILDANHQGRVIFIYSGSPTIEGFTLQNGQPAANSGDVDDIHGGAIRIRSGGSPTIQYNTIISNATVSGGQGGGIYDSGSSTIQHNIIRNNTSLSGHGGGIALNGASNSVIAYNTIFSNTSTSRGGSIYVESASGVIQGNEIFNSTAQFGGGLYIRESAFIVQSNIIHNNKANTVSSSKGGGIRLHSSSNVKLLNNTPFGLPVVPEV